ncbi:DUF1156 domain-containing protein [candidate division KSB1 bacterium]|nr:DUF1156 domain-containing protein [candidate division KSB1 bacterium]RQW06232.1 MAG: DUF1156 domain-containing protein [candidate division KSB1 bacterium]
MPVKEISAESVRDKSIRHGHISTLHLWWARRPLPVCRAVVFASLVPDPLDDNCPAAFREAVDDLLGPGMHGDPYKPYRDIPYTAGNDPMEDNRRNRLLMFIGKFSDAYIQNEKAGKTTPAKDLLSDFSLIKWDNKNNETIINKARKLIWVAFNSKVSTSETKPSPDSAVIANPATSGMKQSPDYQQLSQDFDVALAAIKTAEADLYAHPDRHVQTDEVTAKEAALQNAIDAFLDRMPKVFDPFAGGGAIPLEAARLGCRTYANDLNPVAHIIEKGSLEFPQKYGKSILYSRHEFIRLYPDLFNGEFGVRDGQTHYGADVPEINGVEDALVRLEQIEASEYIRVRNRLAFDVEYYAKKLLRMTEVEIGHLYPADEKGDKPIAYYWARTATCSNPSCGAEVPLLKQFYLVNKSYKKIYLAPIIEGTKISFKISEGSTKRESWIKRGNLICPCCGNITDSNELKRQFNNKLNREILLVTIIESDNGKEYQTPNFYEFDANSKINSNIYRPPEKLPTSYTKAMAFCLWGYSTWGDIYSLRQLKFLNVFSEKMKGLKELYKIFFSNNYVNSLSIYLSIFFDRIASRQITFTFWDVSRETITNPFGKQAIQMVFDYIESNPFCMSSGSALNQLDWIIRYIVSESPIAFPGNCNNNSSADIVQFNLKSIDAVVTDPPYYDAIAYSDLSDFFYIWLKKNLGQEMPNNFAFPLTPKSEECTALKHHHEEDDDKAKNHFENKLLQIFSNIEKQTRSIVSIMFAHQTTIAWSTLCNSILNSNMNITGSWALDSEYTNTGLKANKAFLSSSITVSCIPNIRSGFGSYKNIKTDVGLTIKKEIKKLYNLGFRGADLLTACFGQAVSEFGKYERVEKADGSEVTVAELLDMARDSAFNAIISDIDTDDVTRFYIGWLNLFGFTEAGHDDVRRITQIGLNINVADLLANHILIRNGNKESLATFKERTQALPRLGDKPESYTIDRVHKAMSLYSGNRQLLVRYIAAYAESPLSVFWRVLNSLKEILPAGIDDEKLVSGLLANKDSLIREAKNMKAQSSEQLGLGL